MKHILRRQLNQLLGLLLVIIVFTPSVGAVVVGASQGLCTHVYLPDDSAVTGIEVSLLVNGSTTASAHWGSHSPTDPASRYVNDVPPSDGAWRKMVVELATGLSSPVTAGDEIADVVWTMHRAAGIVEVWSDICLAQTSELGPVITLLGDNPLFLEQGTAFTDPGFECIDDPDGSCTATVDTSALDIDILGDYGVAYSATDSDGNTNQVTRTVSVVVPSFNLGSLTRSTWQGIGGKPVSSLTGSGAYPNNPTSVDPITSFESRPSGDNYGQRIQGYLHPTVTGEYTFWIASDDASQLWLSTNSDSATAAMVAEVPGSNWTGFRQWTKFAQQKSATITLIAGGVYYIEALHKEASGGEHVSVAWQGPGFNQEVIPGTVVSPFVYINEPPSLQLLGAATVNVLSGTAFTDPGFTCQDDFDGDCSADVVVGGDAVETQAEGTYVITYDVADSDGNASPRVTRTVMVGEPALGSITREKWNGLNSGKKVYALTSHANYPDNPSVVDTLTAFDSAPGGSKYGQRIHGFLHPTVTGDYTFWIASDDSSQLWMNTGGTDPSTITKIAEVPGTNRTDYQQWDKFSQQRSVTITLTAGEAYYIRALHKQAWSGQHLEVAWEGPGFPRQIVPGAVLSPMP